MTIGAIITRGTIWLALICYVTTTVFQTKAGARPASLSRFIWLAGCVFFVLHVIAAFQFFHHWSHDVAENATRWQTIERTGLNFGGGIYFNYLFGLAWLADCAGWPLRGKLLHESHPRWRVV
ncbi:MAG TPA: hypothetical protein VGF13_10560, partial [Verrucomicrobiae bacterium]